MKLLIFGKTGQVAQELQVQATCSGVKFIALGRDDVNLASTNQITAAIQAYPADIIINAAAYTNVDEAEVEKGISLSVNANAPFVMAEAAAKKNIPFIHISSDYVFSGIGNLPWNISDTIDPVNFYGVGKAEGERLIASTGGHNTIIRTSWVFSATGKNFLTTIMRIAANQNEIRIVNDQIGGPTSALDLSKAILKVSAKIYEQKQHGKIKRGTQILQYAGMPFVSWAEFAKAIVNDAQLDTVVIPILSSEYPTAATRPKNSRLDGSEIASLYGLQPPIWRDAMSKYIKRIVQ